MNEALVGGLDAGGWYADPSIYDIISTPGTAQEVDMLADLSRRFGLPARPGATWLEPACGTGRYLRVIAGRGIEAVGFDLSPEMGAYARESLRRRGLAGKSRVFTAGMTNFSAAVAPGSIDFAFITDNTLRHLGSDADMLSHLAAVARALKPGGVYAVGISLSVYGDEAPDEDTFTATRGACRVTQVYNYLPPGTGGLPPRSERVISHLMIERPRGVEHRDSVYDLRCYDSRQWSRLLARSDFAKLASVDRLGCLVAGRRMLYQTDVLVPRDAGR